MLRPLAETIPAVTVPAGQMDFRWPAPSRRACMLSELPSFAGRQRFADFNFYDGQIGFLMLSYHLGIVRQLGG